MSTRTTRGRAWFGAVAFLSVVALVVVAGLVFFSRGGGIRASAIFPTAIGIYPGSEVRVLGVAVGEVDEVLPQGTQVRVNFQVDADTPIPADALALVVAPTVVADRAIQLAPAYTGGPTLADGAVIPAARTAVPPEFDDLLAAVQKLSTSLGPGGLNRTGALSEALSVGADNLAGNGQRLNSTLDNFSQAIGTLSGSREDLFGTVRNLQSFTTNLKQNDAQVRDFTRQFAEINRFLAGEREDLGETLKQLSEALGEVAVFVKDNRAATRRNVAQLAEVLNTVNGERLAVEQILDLGPQGLSNLVDTYNASSGTLDTRNATLETAACQIFFQVFGAGGLPGLPFTCTETGQLIPVGVSSEPSIRLAPSGGPVRSPMPMMLPTPRASDSPPAGERPTPLSPAPSGPPSLGELLGGGR